MRLLLTQTRRMRGRLPRTSERQRSSSCAFAAWLLPEAVSSASSKREDPLKRGGCVEPVRLEHDPRRVPLWPHRRLVISRHRSGNRESPFDGSGGGQESENPQRDAGQLFDRPIQPRASRMWRVHMSPCPQVRLDLVVGRNRVGGSS
jgi:hypothetical protein